VLAASNSTTGDRVNGARGRTIADHERAERANHERRAVLTVHHPKDGAPVSDEILTLAIDVGGSGLKAAVLDDRGEMVSERVRVPTPYPLPPKRLVDELSTLVEPLPRAARASVGFPGMVRRGCVLTAPNLATKEGPGSPPDRELVEQWHGFDLAAALSDALGIPVRAANDADVQGAAVVRGEGVELVLTLGTGFGTALFEDGRLLPHLELAHHPFRKGDTYEQQLGDLARRDVGGKRWNQRIVRALRLLSALIVYDHVFLGGGNAQHITVDLGEQATIVSNTAGLLGAIHLWDRT
jgi:polyphosphate glucokinase